MHIGVDRDSGPVHHVKTTSANEHDVTATSELMHGEEETLNGDSGYIGAYKRPEAIKKNKQGKKIKYIINIIYQQALKKRTIRSKKERT